MLLYVSTIYLLRHMIRRECMVSENDLKIFELQENKSKFNLTFIRTNLSIFQAIK